MDGIDSDRYNNGVLWGPTGVFRLSETLNPNVAVYKSTQIKQIPFMTFNLSLSNSIYGKTSKVQPSSYQLLMIIKA